MDKLRVFLVIAGFLANAFALGPGGDQPQTMSSFQRQQAEQMLKDTADTIRKEYFDPTYHGVDFEGRVKEAQQKIQKAQTLSEAFGIIAWMLDVLNDSHTFFHPPSRPYVVEDGWRATFIGEQCLITAVKTGSDADKQGIKPGDQLLTMEGFGPNRATWWKLQYMTHTLAPRSAMKLVVASPGAQPRELTVASAIRNLPKNYDFTGGSVQGDIWSYIRELQREEGLYEQRSVEMQDVMFWKMPTFLTDEASIDKGLGMANHNKVLVLDLRGNGGGYLDILYHLLGGVFDHDVNVGDTVGRKNSKPQKAKSRGGHAFSGKLIVLIDSRSASSSEIFARVVQLEKRGIVLGDTSAGAVMEARRFPHHQGTETMLMYSDQVTVADVKMSDGKSLEKVGVTPDEIVLPTQQDLAAGLDPQLARAAQLAGIQMTAAKAGTLFKTEWR